MAETFFESQVRKINERNDRRLGITREVTNVVADEPVAEAVDVCPTCGKSGDESCVTPSGKVKDTWHAKRGS